MKTIGRTDEGSYLVEMTKGEHEALRMLQHALSGSHWDWGFFASDENGKIYPGEMSDTFQAIRRWSQSCFEVNRMQRVVDELKGLLDAVALERDE